MTLLIRVMSDRTFRSPTWVMSFSCLKTFMGSPRSLCLVFEAGKTCAVNALQQGFPVCFLGPQGLPANNSDSGEFGRSKVGHSCENNQGALLA